MIKNANYYNLNILRSSTVYYNFRTFNFGLEMGPVISENQTWPTLKLELGLFSDFKGSVFRVWRRAKKERKREEKMVVMQWCGAAVRRVVAVTQRRPPLMSFYSSAMLSPAPAPAPVSACGRGIGEAVVCGRGDKKTKRGKRFKGSYGNARPKKEKKIERIKDKVEVPRSTPWPLPFKLI